MYAVIETGGKQYRVTEGDVINVEKLDAEAGKANAIAKELNARGNMVLLGAAAPYLEIPFDELEKAIKAIFGRKGDAVVETNIKAIRAGRDAK